MTVKSFRSVHTFLSKYFAEAIFGFISALTFLEFTHVKNGDGSVMIWGYLFWLDLGEIMITNLITSQFRPQTSRYLMGIWTWREALFVASLWVQANIEISNNICFQHKKKKKSKKG